MDETMQRIHEMANERLRLYTLASKQRLTDAQQARIREITDQLPLMWDRHRRELAARRSERERGSSRKVSMLDREAA